MRQWKIAFSLAIVGAIGAPFAFHTSKMHPTSETWVPLTQDQKASIAAHMEETDNCQTLEGRVPKSQSQGLLSNNDFLREVGCHGELDRLNRGGEFQVYFSTPKYLAANLAAAFGGFLGVFGLAFLLPAIVRCYWKWLNA
jgi:hypothetical protein